MAHQSRKAEHLLAEMAGKSHGVVIREDLLHAGITRDQITHRIRNGSLIRVYTGVYRVGHRAPSLEARYLAAVRACGQGAALSGLAAAYLQGLIRGRPPPPEVTSPRHRQVKGIKIKRSRTLSPQQVTVWRGIPVTRVPRTLVDLAQFLSLNDLSRACHEAGVKHHTSPAQVSAVLAGLPNAPGAAKLRRVLYGDVRVTLSRLESKFLERLREATLPLPQTNRPAGDRRVDCRWPEHRLTVELDSYRYHSSRHAWEQDRRREREAYARGDDLRRYTAHDVFDAPQPMLAELRALLTAVE